MREALNFHEDLKRPVGARGSSDRQFGLVFAAVFALLGLRPLWHGGPAGTSALVVAGLCVLIATIRPAFLHPLNQAWTKLGQLLGRIVNPVVTALLFFLVFTPAGLLMRLLGKDPLRLRPERGASTYWIARQPPGPQPETMSKQF